MHAYKYNMYNYDLRRDCLYYIYESSKALSGYNVQYIVRLII